MKPEELRIGNYVIYEGSIEKIQCGEQIDCNRGETIKPIPLTEQWLLDFGAEKNIKGLNYIEDFEFSIGADHIMVFYKTLFLISVEHVHELQNLYHALTGKELTLNNQ